MVKKCKLIILWLIIMFVTMLFVTNTKVEAANGVDPSDYRFNGFYTGNASAVFFQDGGSGSSLWFESQTSFTCDSTVNNTQDKVFTANSIRITGDQMINGNGSKVIGINNYTAKTNTSNAFRVAQQFTVDNLSAITDLWLFLEHNISMMESHTFKARITEEDLSTTLEEDEIFPFNNNASEWYSFWFEDNILEPGKTYYIVFEVENSTAFPNVTLAETNYWQAELHTSPDENKGDTLFFNGSAWNPIHNDTWRDMLCWFNYTILVDPNQVDLKIDLNGTLCNYQIRESQLGMFPGYEIFCTTYFQTIQTGMINVSVQLNTTIESMFINADLRYIHIIPAILGRYTATPNKINWTIIYDYPYIEVDSYADSMFAYESDWDYLEFTDQSIVANDLYTGPTRFYNFSGYAAFPPDSYSFNTGNITGTFTSPNYCTAITPKAKSNSVFQTVSNFELGETVRLEALIKDGTGTPISGGKGTINFTSPSGSVTSFTNLSSNNGNLSTTEIELGSGFETGLYTVSVIWTNGKEVGCYVYQVDVTSPPAASDDIMLFILIGALVALGVVSSLLVLKMKGILWAKGPLNVFISHKAEDYEAYKVKDLSEYLVKKKEVGSAFFFESDLVGNIDDWMKETVPISQLLVFFATQQSLKSKDCQNEIKLAKDAGIDIIPIKGNDISWEDLIEHGLDRQKGISFSDYKDNHNLFLNDLHNYINQFKQELDVILVVLNKSRVSNLNLIQLETNLSPEKIWRYSRTLIQMKKLEGVWTKEKMEFIRADEIMNRMKILQNYGKIKDITQIAKSLGIDEAYTDILDDILKSELD